MREKEKTAVPVPSVGADGEQSLSYVSNEIIATEKSLRYAGDRHNMRPCRQCKLLRELRCFLPRFEIQLGGILLIKNRVDFNRTRFGDIKLNVAVNRNIIWGVKL